jgi:hypothetical protein
MWLLLRHLPSSPTGGDIWPVVVPHSGCSSNNDYVNNDNNSPGEEILNVKHQHLGIQLKKKPNRDT